MPTTSAAPSPQGPWGPFGPIDIALQADIRAPVELVWSLLVDWEHMGRWMREASGFRVMTSHREGVGVEVEAKVHIGGITTTDTVRVTRWEPPHVLAADHLGWVKGDAIMQCLPTEGGTRLEWVERLVPPLGPLGGIGIRVFKPLMVRTFMRDLSLLKRLAETKAGTRNPQPPSPEQTETRPRTRPAGPEGPPEAATAVPETVPAHARLRQEGPARRTRPAKATSAAGRRGRGPLGSSLFARWFWLVYLPLGLTAAVLLLMIAGLMPAALKVPLLLVAGAWSLMALWLLVERRRRRVAVPAPRRLLLGIGAVAVMAGAGALLTWVGIGRVSSSEGLAMVLIGCFFILMAVFAPMFKLVDSVLRLVARVLTRRSRSSEPAPAAPSAPSAPATSSGPATPATESTPATSPQP